MVVELTLSLAKPFEEVQKRVASLTKDRILVGHAVHNDLKVSSHVQPVHSLPLIVIRFYYYPILVLAFETRNIWLQSTT